MNVVPGDWPRMNGNEREYLNDLAERVIGAAYEVSNTLGIGYLEKVYERALLIELGYRGIKAVAQAPIEIFYKGEPIGDYFADILIEDSLVVELKCAESFANEHLAQCLNYLRATNHRLALLFNFQRPKVEWKRVVWNF
jgi:GxxExxY protein